MSAHFPMKRCSWYILQSKFYNNIHMKQIRHVWPKIFRVKNAFTSTDPGTHKSCIIVAIRYRLKQKHSYTLCTFPPNISNTIYNNTIQNSNFRLLCMWWMSDEDNCVRYINTVSIREKVDMTTFQILKCSESKYFYINIIFLSYFFLLFF